MALSRNPASKKPQKPCPATQKTAYEIRSVVDYHNEHNGPTSVVLTNQAPTTSSSKHISELEEKPPWVEKVTSIAANRVQKQTPQTIFAELTGPEIPWTIATSETEYNVIFSQTDQWVENS